MKKLIVLLLSFVVVLSNTCFAEWIHSEKANGWLFRDESQNKLITSSWHLIDAGENKQRYYYFNEYGFLVVNGKTPDGKSVNENGEWVENGVIQEKQKSSTQTINATGKELVEKNKTNAETLETMKSSNDSNNIIYAQQGESSGRLLKNYIVASQNVEIFTEKSINGSKKTNVIAFKQNGAFISINTKKQNKIILKCERDKSNIDIDFRLALIVNGEEQDSLEFEDDQYETEQEFTYSLNDDVDLVMYTNSSGSSWSSKYLYITSGRMSKYKEEDDE